MACEQSLFTFSLRGLDAVTVAGALAHLPYTLFFDSADPGHALSRVSIVCFAPFEVIESKGDQVTVTTGREQKAMAGDPFEILRDRLALWNPQLPPHPDLPGFQGGAAGCFGYDLARGIERLPDLAQDDNMVPDMMVGLYDQMVLFDHQRGRCWFATIAERDDKAKARHATLMTLLKNSRPVQPSFPVVDFTPETSRADYMGKVCRVVNYIHAGDIFQANLSQRFAAVLPDSHDRFAHYLHLRRASQAPYAAFMNFGDIALSSASPERFLNVQARQVDTRPIKGTRPRGHDAASDLKAMQDLARSAKDRAENAMIVDLLRNDLSKVCEDHSIDVPELCAVESFSNVHHLVSTVRGTLRADRGPVDLLRACFPGGSITGAPKVRAMEIIETLENKRRGPYCGALGLIGFNGFMETSIAIRTLVYQGNQVSFNVGGGIVADSDPAAEYQETLDKAAGLLASFAAPARKAAAA